MAIDGGSTALWAKGVQDVLRQPGWAKKNQVLTWVDNGNSWVKIKNESTAIDRVREYGTLAAAMFGCWEYVIYVAAGGTQVPKWEDLSTPRTRKLREKIILKLR